MTILTDVRAYLATVGVPTGKYMDATLNEVIAVETEAQAHKTGAAIASFPAAAQLVLTEALCRRVQVNLSKRALPLGITDSGGDADTGRVFIPGRDPEVTRLERPYAKVRVG